MTTCNIAIVGAGPYGLSIAAHLRAKRVDHRVFGGPMEFWRTHMPKGMLLKSEGFASCLYDPDDTFTLEHYCREAGLPYADIGLPTPLSTFISYGLAFQKRFVPELESRQVTSLDRSPDGYRMRFADGEVLTARKVVVATGMSCFEYIPPVLSQLPKEFISHSSSHHALDRFAGREVAVLGAGASALDLAALLHQAGARTQVVARKSSIDFQDPPEKDGRSLWFRLRFPMTGIGSGWQLFWCSNLPAVFRLMP